MEISLRFVLLIAFHFFRAPVRLSSLSLHTNPALYFLISLKILTLLLIMTGVPADNDSTTLECSDIAKQRAVDDVALDIGGFVKVGMLNKQGRDFVVPHVREFIDEVGIELSRHFVIKLR